MTIYKRVLGACCCAALLMAASGCRRGPSWQSMEGSVWGTVYHIKWAGAPSLSDTVLAVMDSIDESLSMFRPTSLTGRFNAGDTTVRADAALRRVVEVSQRVSALSGGRFDPTVGPLVEAWGFGRRVADEGWAEPPAALLDSLLQGVGIGRLHIDGEGRLLAPSPLTRLDFSAIAKGYGCDRIAAALRRNGVADMIVEVGGEVALAGHNPRGEAWRVAVDRPDGTGPGDIVVSADRPCGIATSGNYRNYRRLAGGDTVGHTINPLTGRPAAAAVLSATVVAPDCLTADALATACMAMEEPDSALAMVGRVEGARAILILPDLSVAESAVSPRAAAGR